MERLQKVLAHAGVASRRRAEALIETGRVRVNGRLVTKLGTRVDPERDLIIVDGRPIPHPASHTCIVLNKPRGVLSTTSDPYGRVTVLDLVQTEVRVCPVGRLDKDSEGLILLTDDGDLAYRLTHPRYEQEKEYRVLVEGSPDEGSLQQLREGVELDEGRTWPAAVEMEQGGKAEREGTWLRIVIHEGRKRQVRRMCQAVGHRVRRLIRVRMGPLELGQLQPGQWRFLTRSEVRALKRGRGRD